MTVMDQDYPPQQPPPGYYPPQQQPQQPPPGYYPPPQPRQQPPPYGYANPSPANGIGIAAMVVGIVGLALFWIPIVGLVLSVVAIPLAVVGLRRTMGMAPTATNKGMAITGLVTGIIGLALSALWTIAVFSAADDTDDYFDCIDRADTIEEMDACE
jgi:hypothetical protein